MEFRGLHQQILDDETGEIDVEGARMSGKTWTICAKIVFACLKNPGMWWLICRYSGTETDDQLRPQFVKVARMLGVSVEWDGDESCYNFPAQGGEVSKVFAYGLKTQSKEQRFAKVRGSGFAGVWNDQSEEIPEDIGTEIRALVRQPGFPHQLIFSPNPVDEEHFLADQFPDDQDLPDRKYYRLSLYDNAHNLPADAIRKLEAAYPRTHAKHKSLILGMRGPNITGTPVYDGAFLRELHVSSLVKFDPDLPLLEGLDEGKHHPAWLCAQRTNHGALHILGGLLGKRMFIDDFELLVDKYRLEWFGRPQTIQRCGNAKRSGFTFRQHSNDPDVREKMIQTVGSMMRRRAGVGQALQVTDDSARFIMASYKLHKTTKIFVDSLEGSYVWDENYLSVGHLRVRQPKFDQWVEGWQRCQENILFNFCYGKKTDAELAEERQRQREAANSTPETRSVWS